MIVNSGGKLHLVIFSWLLKNHCVHPYLRCCKLLLHGRWQRKFQNKSNLFELIIWQNSLQVNVGCVPKKLMFNAAMHAEELHDQEGYGHNVKQTAPFDWK